jgi:hypothetical protein
MRVDWDLIEIVFRFCTSNTSRKGTTQFFCYFQILLVKARSCIFTLKIKYKQTPSNVLNKRTTCETHHHCQIQPPMVKTLDFYTGSLENMYSNVVHQREVIMCCVTSCQRRKVILLSLDKAEQFFVLSRYM